MVSLLENTKLAQMPFKKTSPPPEGPGVGFVIKATIVMESPGTFQNPGNSNHNSSHILSF